MTDHVEGVLNRIHEPSYDLLVRLVPGIVFVSAYYPATSLDAFSAVAALAVAYAVGFAFDFLSATVDNSRSVTRRLEPGSNHKRPLSNRRLWSFEPQATDKGRYLKMLCERQLCRSFVLVSLCFAFVPPAFAHRAISSFPNIVGIVLAVISLIGYWQFGLWLSENIRGAPPKTEAGDSNAGLRDWFAGLFDRWPSRSNHRGEQVNALPNGSRGTRDDE